MLSLDTRLVINTVECYFLGQCDRRWAVTSVVDSAQVILDLSLIKMHCERGVQLPKNMALNGTTYF